jgi:hypothetical protein
MNITSPAQAFALRDKLATILGTQLQGYSSEAYQAADAETLLGLGIIDWDALGRYGEPSLPVAVSHPATEPELLALPLGTVLADQDGDRYVLVHDEGADEARWTGLGRNGTFTISQLIAYGGLRTIHLGSGKTVA